MGECGRTPAFECRQTSASSAHRHRHHLCAVRASLEDPAEKSIQTAALRSTDNGRSRACFRSGCPLGCAPSRFLEYQYERPCFHEPDVRVQDRLPYHPGDTREALAVGRHSLQMSETKCVTSGERSADWQWSVSSRRGRSRSATSAPRVMVHLDYDAGKRGLEQLGVGRKHGAPRLLVLRGSPVARIFIRDLDGESMGRMPINAGSAPSGNVLFWCLVVTPRNTASGRSAIRVGL